MMSSIKENIWIEFGMRSENPTTLILSSLLGFFNSAAFFD